MTRHAAMMLTEKQKSGGDDATTVEDEELRFDRSNVTRDTSKRMSAMRGGGAVPKSR